MELEYDPVLNLRHFPVPMARFGKNPFGENLYRIVFTSSRRHLVGGRWPDGTTGYHWVPKYRKVKAGWILERWNTAWQFAGMSQREWDTTMIDPVSGWLLLGPYPARGEYDLAWEFDAGVDADSLDKIIGAVELGRNRSFEDLRQFHKAEYAGEEKQWKGDANAEVRDAVTAFGNAALSSRLVSRGSKTRGEIRYTAEEAGMPIPRANRKRNPKDLRGLDVTSTLFTGRMQNAPNHSA